MPTYSKDDCDGDGILNWKECDVFDVLDKNWDGPDACDPWPPKS